MFQEQISLSDSLEATAYGYAERLPSVQVAKLPQRLSSALWSWTVLQPALGCVFTQESSCCFLED